MKTKLLRKFRKRFTIIRNKNSTHEFILFDNKEKEATKHKYLHSAIGYGILKCKGVYWYYEHNKRQEEAYKRRKYHNLKKQYKQQ